MPFLGDPAAPDSAKAVRAVVGVPKESSPGCHQALRESEATWKFIVNEVPITGLMVLPYDRWQS